MVVVTNGQDVQDVNMSEAVIQNDKGRVTNRMAERLLSKVCE